jgi:hypothetical protein
MKSGCKSYATKPPSLIPTSLLFSLTLLNLEVRLTLSKTFSTFLRIAWERYCMYYSTFCFPKHFLTLASLCNKIFIVAQTSMKRKSHTMLTVVQLLNENCLQKSTPYMIIRQLSCLHNGSLCLPKTLHKLAKGRTKI